MNLTRFPLFFPEKRAFFLQDTSYFNFGGLQGPPMPFFTRKIGLSNDGEPIDIIGGMKLSGRTGPMSFGLLDVQTHSFDNVASKNLAVGRTMLDLGKESSAGLIFTHGNSLGPGDNTLGGVDFHYKDSNVLGSDQVIEANGYMMHSEGWGQSGNALGLRLLYPNFHWNGALNFDQIGQGFDPALGFIDRPGIRVYEAWLGPEWRPTGFDHMLVWPYIYMRTDLDAASSTACCGSPSSSLKRRAAITSCSPPSLPKSSSSSLSISCVGVPCVAPTYRYSDDAGTAVHGGTQGRVRFKRHDGAQGACNDSHPCGCGELSRDKMPHSQTALVALCYPPVARFVRCMTHVVSRRDSGRCRGGGLRERASENHDGEETEA